eukprot:1191079-Prorocentrum_minimum.AAC.4
MGGKQIVRMMPRIIRLYNVLYVRAYLGCREHPRRYWHRRTRGVLRGAADGGGRRGGADAAAAGPRQDPRGGAKRRRRRPARRQLAHTPAHRRLRLGLPARPGEPPPRAQGGRRGGGRAASPLPRGRGLGCGLYSP